MFALDILNRIDRGLATLADRMQDCLDRGRERRRLLALDDRTLHDIAASRADAERASYKSM